MDHIASQERRTKSFSNDVVVHAFYIPSTSIKVDTRILARRSSYEEGVSSHRKPALPEVDLGSIGHSRISQSIEGNSQFLPPPNAGKHNKMISLPTTDGTLAQNDDFC
jgi:hypothetical protein